MEILGFYDEPYQVRVAKPRLPERAAGRVARTHSQPASPTVHSARVDALWETTEINESAFERWAPAVVARRKLGGRRFRLSTLVGATGLVTILAFGILQLVERPAQQATRSLAAVGEDARSLITALPEVVEVASRLADPSGPELGPATAATLSAETAARSLFTAAADLAEDQSVIRNRAVEASSAVLDATSQFNRLLAYRIAVTQTLIPPGPGSEEVSSATAEITEWRATVTDAWNSLPAELLPAHRQQLDAWVAGLEGWQQSYLDALREGDLEAASVLAGQLDSEILRLHRHLREELARERDSILDQLVMAESLLVELVGP